MNLAFALFHYFPYGGLERDMLTVARECQQRGHDITIYTGDWQGEKPADMRVVELPTRAPTNHGRAREFSTHLKTALRTGPAAAVIGFNKMPGLDIYYAADTCFAAKAFEERNIFYRLTPRCRAYLELEKVVFDRNSATEILLPTRTQIEIFQRYYQTLHQRLHLLPPGIRRECVIPGNYAFERNRLREQYDLRENELLILFVGSDYRRKGLDRALRGIATLAPELRSHVRLWVAGQDKPAKFIDLARTLNLENSVKFLGARDDVPQLMWCADMLLHPAYSEAAGLVLLEAMVAGLPVVASATCGYAHYIGENTLGHELTEPITASSIATAITKVFSVNREIWQQRSRSFADHADIFSMPQYAAALIETVASNKMRLSQAREGVCLTTNG